MSIHLLIDFGSTWTKVLAVDLATETIVGSAQAPTTVETDITLGLDQALADLRSTFGVDPARVAGMYASSSAAGGLKMAAIGLVPELTLEAARRACLRAGAKVVCAYGFEIDTGIVREIEAAKCDLVLLCGGTDGGDKKTILHNAGMLARSGVACPLLVAGNRVATEQVVGTLEHAGKKVYAAENVLPSLDIVEVEPAQELIREIFISHITRAKGLEKAAALVEAPIMPTPRATLQAAALLADGVDAEPGLGSLMVVEVGGATTNIHSVAEQSPASPQTILRGLPEPRVKRTVEGDLGIRYNAATILGLVGREAFLSRLGALSPGKDAAGFDPEAYVEHVSHNVGYAPAREIELSADIALACSAVDIAARRHAGTLQQQFTVAGDVMVQRGKNLLGVRNVVGTGGIFRYGLRPERVLGSALFDPAEPWSLRPRGPELLVDHEYMLYGMGLLAQGFSRQALRIAKKYLVKTGPLDPDPPTVKSPG